MPHTNKRKKKKTNSAKRIEVVDESGWTRITTNAGLNNLASRISDHDHHTADADGLQHWSTEVPSDATLEKIVARFEQSRKLWQASESYKSLEMAIRKSLAESNPMEDCILFGSGTFCGYNKNWIARHDVALVQTAAFVSAVDLIGN
jgi:hypothetical protein